MALAKYTVATEFWGIAMAPKYTREQVYEYVNALSEPKRRKWLVREQRYPRLLFKYFPLQPKPEDTKVRFRQIIVESKLWMSAVADFNDPFDAQMAFSGGGTAEQQKAHLLEIFRTTPTPAGHNPLTEAEFEKKAAAAIAAGNIGTAAQRGYDNALAKMGVCCFASDARSILMWSHYATSHRGICAVFEPAAGPEPLLEALPVKYTREYPKFDKVLDDPMQLARRGLLRKFKRWQYEGERRIIRMNSSRSFITFQPPALLGIILGCVASDETQKIVGELVEERVANKQPDVQILRAKKHSERYELCIHSG
jgi:hypothetical protein